LRKRKRGDKTLDSKPAPQRRRRQMLSLGFGLQAEPQGVLNERERGRRTPSQSQITDFELPSKMRKYKVFGGKDDFVEAKALAQ